jgi:hypothetical protein
VVLSEDYTSILATIAATKTTWEDKYTYGKALIKANGLGQAGPKAKAKAKPKACADNKV